VVFIFRLIVLYAHAHVISKLSFILNHPRMKLHNQGFIPSRTVTETRTAIGQSRCFDCHDLILNMFHEVMRISALLVCFLLVISIPFICSYGNEYAVYERAKELAEKHHLNVTEYSQEIDACRAQPKLFQCVRWINRWHRQHSAVWSFSSNESQADCHYQLTKTSTFLIHDADSWVFSVNISQYKCKSDVGMAGGSTFEVFAYNDENHVACDVVDHFNMSYSVQCLFHSSQPIIPNRQSCVYLTVILSREHFDDANVALLDYTIGYPPRRLLIADNISYCGSLSDSAKPMHYYQQLDPKTGVDTMSWYTGYWQRGSIHPPNRSATYHWNSSHEIRFSLIEDISSIYASYDGFIDQPLSSSSPEASLIADPSILATHFFFHRVKPVAKSAPTRTTERDGNMQYHFFGSSHMRFWFDGFIVKIYGEIFDNLNLDQAWRRDDL
jgi:hypothetical protein